MNNSRQAQEEDVQAEDIQQMASRCSAAASKLMCTISP